MITRYLGGSRYIVLNYYRKQVGRYMNENTDRLQELLPEIREQTDLSSPSSSKGSKRAADLMRKAFVDNQPKECRKPS